MALNLNQTESLTVNNFKNNPAPETFNPVVIEYYGMVRKMAYRIVLNESDAEDIAQEVFISAYSNFSSFRWKSKLSSWLCRIACNKAYSLLRERKDTIINIEDEPHISGSKSLHPDKNIVSDESNIEITEALASLPDYLRAAITLVTIDDVPAEEAALILNCNKATLYWRLHKARKLLKEKLEHLL